MDVRALKWKGAGAKASWNYENSHVKNTTWTHFKETSNSWGETANHGGVFVPWILQPSNLSNCFSLEDSSVSFFFIATFFHPHSSVEYQQNKLSFMSSKSNRIFFITVTFSSLLVFEESFRWSQRLFHLLHEQSAGIFIAIVPYTITRSSGQSHKNFCKEGKGWVCRREKCLSWMKEYNSYMFPFIWNKLNAMCSP